MYSAEYSAGTVLFIVLLFSFVPANIAKSKGYSFWGWYGISFLISPLISSLILLAMKNLNDDLRDRQIAWLAKRASSRQRNLERICAHCGIINPAMSAFCGSCGSALSSHVILQAPPIIALPPPAVILPPKKPLPPGLQGKQRITPTVAHAPSVTRRVKVRCEVCGKKVAGKESKIRQQPSCPHCGAQPFTYMLIEADSESAELADAKRPRARRRSERGDNTLAGTE